MSRHLFHRPLRIGLPWLVWLALLLPLGQAAAAWHEASHTAEAADVDDGQKALHSAACGLCLASAAVHGAGGMPADAPAVAHPAVAQARPLQATPAERPAAPALGYSSRAPPCFLA